MNCVTINIESLLGSDIRIRSRVLEIAALMDADSCYVLDFKGVNFISRSFADELISMLEQTSKHIDIIHMGLGVKEMFDIVRKGRHIKHDSARNEKIIALENMDEVEMFFCK